MHSKRLLAYALLSPSLAIVTLLIVYPFFNGIWLSLHTKHLLRPGMHFVGLKNFVYLFRNDQYWMDFWNTVLWTAGSVALQHLVALPIALLLNQKIKFRFLFRGIFLIPWVCPVVVFALLWQWLYNDLYGVINYLLITMGVIDTPIIWLGSKNTAMISAIVANTWKGFSFPMIAMLAQLQMIPSELYEAAGIDGASKWQQFVHITLPYLKAPTVITTLIVSIWTFNNFGTMYLLTGGGPVKATETLSILAYLTSFSELRLGRGAAITVTMMFVLLVISLIYLNRAKIEEE
ncbi:MAG: sugar ABC transporter permease [Deltaproteobacteria bacterium]|nr:sugar ABC transporter permease [Deltaproteobacteria bacterium]MBW2121180.1 sugar ABC transporter permease [Deltaproteobacteria bacterium]